ncbi:MBL fold metallo-hydrolase [Pseudoalteromonas luteoviolacea]|uniref:MBL fold metallo-hydrolase n=1 Tax=Pseudoalteromonas luteoviolacea TaxID=43657 RepID=A0A1C0TVC1_9GAMM|nr:MBL fold metallo-hydrolase [Pseudoalteromonas luteoviolacea]OCQ23184.1 MBL fold metallo-hydrolase [Pseudoalteromonas luteoviolacea]
MRIKILIASLVLTGCSTTSMSNSPLDKRELARKHDITTAPSLSGVPWVRGAQDCSRDTQPIMDVFHYDVSTAIIRQNKCVTFEAPFSYVLVGSEKVMVVDTGALADEKGFSYAEALLTVMGKSTFEQKETLVVHSHSHSDHHQGDAGFERLNNTRVIAPQMEQVQAFLETSDWPNGQFSLDLGGRLVTILPTPGHQEEAITIYDHKNKWLITGDTLYPGLVYVKDWQAYKTSIAKLTKFAQQNEVTAILGGHIEMTKSSGKYYPIGTTYQPNEAPLPLSVADLYELNTALQKSEKEQAMIFKSFVIQPMSMLQKSISNIFRWVTN